MSTRDMTKMEEARARLVATIATMGSQAAGSMIAAEALANAGPGMCMGTKAPEPKFTVAEQMDQIAARVASRRAQVAA
jgi:hypothetical protein